MRDAIERGLPDDRFGAARHVGGYWNRTSTIEVDLVGGDAAPVADAVAFVGSIKWRDGAPFERADAAALAAHRAGVPGASDATVLVGVSRDGFDVDARLDVRLTSQDIIASYSRG